MRGSKNPDRCRFDRCNKDAVLTYYDRGLCLKHWNVIAVMPTDKAKKRLGIKVEKEKK